jgi:hypothetical protein
MDRWLNLSLILERVGQSWLEPRWYDYPGSVGNRTNQPMCQGKLACFWVVPFMAEACFPIFLCFPSRENLIQYENQASISYRKRFSRT